MASPDESSAIDLIRQHLLLDDPSFLQAYSVLDESNFVFPQISSSNSSYSSSDEQFEFNKMFEPVVSSCSWEQSGSFNDRKPSLNVSIPFPPPVVEKPVETAVEEMVIVKSNGRKRTTRDAEVEKREIQKETKIETEESVFDGDSDKTGGTAVPLTPSCWTAFWDDGYGDGNGMGIFEVPPLSPYPTVGFSSGCMAI
ncbi:hypothetical protein L1987_75181 [Smallanthus sonchifolius]|uniref:Uncharacterized protein n=1 Tax=Smallanthus sonchifolius TaxID=185202 RepID=A0ACB9A601_9ASTR|nr:hypothetical protein L1987_75181 [Smallanthus sonchifolius]